MYFYRNKAKKQAKKKTRNEKTGGVLLFNSCVQINERIQLFVDYHIANIISICIQRGMQVIFKQTW